MNPNLCTSSATSNRLQKVCGDWNLHLGGMVLLTDRYLQIIYNGITLATVICCREDPVLCRFSQVKMT